MIELVFETIREPMRIVNVPVAIGKLLAAPRERFFKSVQISTLIQSTALPDCITDVPKEHGLLRQCDPGSRCQTLVQLPSDEDMPSR